MNNKLAEERKERMKKKACENVRGGGGRRLAAGDWGVQSCVYIYIPPSASAKNICGGWGMEGISCTMYLSVCKLPIERVYRSP